MYASMIDIIGKDSSMRNGHKYLTVCSVGVVPLGNHFFNRTFALNLQQGYN